MSAFMSLTAQRLLAPGLARLGASQHRTLSTTRAALNAAQKDDPSSSGFNFSFKSLTANPRMRFFLIATVVTLASIETAAWIKFWPHITGKKKTDSGSEWFGMGLGKPTEERSVCVGKRGDGDMTDGNCSLESVDGFCVPPCTNSTSPGDYDFRLFTLR